MDQLRKDGDSCGARVDVVARGVPVGLGEPLYDKLDADIAHAMMGINAVKGVEIGAGFNAVEQRGTTHGDELTPEGFRQQQRRRRPRRHLDRPGHHRLARDQADQLDPQPAPLDRPARQARRRRDARPPRSLRRHPRHADRRGDAGAGADGPRAAPSRAVRRRPRAGPADSRPGALSAVAPAGAAGAADGRSVRGRLVRLLRLRRPGRDLWAALVPEPRLLDLRHRRSHLAAELDAPLQPLRLGLGLRPHRPARAAAADRRGRLAARLAGLLRARRLRLGRRRDGRPLRLHRRA